MNEDIVNFKFSFFKGQKKKKKKGMCSQTTNLKLIFYGKIFGTILNQFSELKQLKPTIRLYLQTYICQTQMRIEGES